MLWHAYGIIARADAGLIDPPPGIDGAPSQIVPGGDLAAVAAHLHRDSFSAAAVTAHDQVIQDIFSRVPIMPLRFGTHFASREDIERLLKQDEARWRSRFDVIRDSAQWQVRLHADPAPSEPDADDDAWPGEVHAKLAAHAVDRQDDVFLVRRDDEYWFVSAADAMTERCRQRGLRLEVHGPHPAYHFAGLSVGVRP